MGRRLTYEEIKNLFSKRDYELLETTYINSKTKMKYRCLKHPDEIQYIHYNSLSSGRGCKYCGLESKSEKKRLSYDKVKQEFEKRGYILLEKEYKNNRQMLRYLCTNHPEKDNYITYSDLQQGVGCPYCVGLKKFTYEEVKIEFENHNFILVDTEYKNSSTHMKCYCKFHPDIIQYKTLQQIRNEYRCIYCAGKKATYETSLGHLYPNLINEWDLTKNAISPFDVLPKSNKRVWWKCFECSHEWYTSISSRTNKHSGCPACNESKGEKRIRDYLLNINENFVSQKEFDGLIGIRGGSLSYDFYLPNHNLLIEFQGEQHERFIKGIHGDKDEFKRQQEHDRRKRVYAEQNGIKLLEIWYCDYDNIEEILKDKHINLVV